MIYTGGGMEGKVEERTVLKEEVAEIFINGKNKMAVLNTGEFNYKAESTQTPKRKTDFSAVHRILLPPEKMSGTFW